MEIFEITAYQTGVARDGVNYLEPSDSFVSIKDGFIHRQVLQSRGGFAKFGDQVDDATRIFGIFEWKKQDDTTELLVFSKDYLYTYNTTTNVFDQIVFGATASAFNIADDADYISGTTYPDKNGASRFVFCSKGMAKIYFYDGTNVHDYTNVAANADYVAPAAGAFTKAWHVEYFGERLNFFYPTVNAVDLPQDVLYSGIRDSAGTGDDFNTPGAGQLAMDSRGLIRGVKQSGDVIVTKTTNGDWLLEKTRDAFNPYTWRRIPSVQGTDAGFTLVEWDDEVRSLGRNGVITTDKRQSSRIDNKIPNFTRDEIDPENFDLCAGGFDRRNGQFLFSYLDIKSDLDTQSNVLVHNYEENSWSVYDARFTVFGETEKGVSLAWNDINATSKPQWASWDTTTEIWNKIGNSVAEKKTLAGDDRGYVYQLDQDDDDYFIDIDITTPITKASSAVITTKAQSYEVGDRIAIFDVQGMTQINNFDPASPRDPFVPAIVTARTDTTLTVNVDSTEFDTHTAGGYVSKVIEFEAETIPFNPWRELGRRAYVSHIELLLDSTCGRVQVDCIADEESQPFKSAEAVPSSSEKRRQWITIAINEEANFLTFRLRHESPTRRFSMTSMRIHAMAGGQTLG